MIPGMAHTTHILLSTGSVFHLSFDEIFQAACESGFDGLELILDAAVADTPTARLMELSERRGLPIACVHAPFFPLPFLGGSHVRGIELAITLARAVGSAMVNAHPFSLVSDAAESQRLLSLAGELILGIENMPRGIEIYDEGEAQIINDHDALNHFARDNGLKVTYDVSHFATWDQSILKGYRLFRADLINIHLSDYAVGRQHLLPGEGQLPLARLLESASADGRARFITLETTPGAFGDGGLPEIVAALTKARDFIEASMSN